LTAVLRSAAEGDRSVLPPHRSRARSGWRRSIAWPPRAGWRDAT